MRCAVAHKANWAKPRGSGGGPWGLNLFGSHSPPLAARLARVSEPDVWLTTTRERLTVSSPNTPPLGAGILYCPICHKKMKNERGLKIHMGREHPEHKEEKAET